MKNKKMIVITFICLIPLIVGLFLYPQIPDKIVTHWGATGEPNGYSSKFVGIVLFPLFLTLISLTTPKLIDLDPTNKDMNEKLKNVIIWIIPVVSFICSSITLLSALGIKIRVEIIVPMAIGIMLAIMGNYLPKAKLSYTVGIKIPWTLNDEENWNKTHRVGGFVFFIGGIVIAISSLFSCRLIVILISLFAMIIIPTTYSYMLYKKKNHKTNKNAT